MLAIAAYIVFVIWFIGTAGSASGIWDEFEQGFEEGLEDGDDRLRTSAPSCPTSRSAPTSPRAPA